MRTWALSQLQLFVGDSWWMLVARLQDLKFFHFASQYLTVAPAENIVKHLGICQAVWCLSSPGHDKNGYLEGLAHLDQKLRTDAIRSTSYLEDGNPRESHPLLKLRT